MNAFCPTWKICSSGIASLEASRQVGHDDGGLGGLVALVGGAFLGAGEGLLQSVGCEDAEDYRHSSCFSCLGDAAGDLLLDVDVVVGLALDYTTQADHGVD